MNTVLALHFCSNLNGKVCASRQWSLAFGPAQLRVMLNAARMIIKLNLWPDCTAPLWIFEFMNLVSTTLFVWLPGIKFIISKVVDKMNFLHTIMVCIYEQIFSSKNMAQCKIPNWMPYAWYLSLGVEYS